MYRACVLVVAAVAATGCHGGPGRQGRMRLPADCAPADCAPAPRGHATPKVEVQRCDDDVQTVKAPKVVVELPPCPSESCRNAPSCQPDRGAPRAAPAPPAPAQTFAAPGLVGTPVNTSFGLTANGAQVMSARPAWTRLAFTPTTIRIPFPWLKCVPVEEPEELTFRVTNRTQVHSSGGSFNAFTTGPVMTAGFPMAAMPMGAMHVQTQVCPPCPPSISPERVEEFTRRIQELEGQVRAAQAAGAPQGAPEPCPPIPPRR